MPQSNPTRVLDVGDDCREWSVLNDDETLDPPLRMSVLAERDGLIRIGHVCVTSRTEAAQEMRRSQPFVSWIRGDEAEWLVEQLTEALKWRKQDAG